jgi:hypothetical protein
LSLWAQNFFEIPKKIFLLLSIKKLTKHAQKVEFQFWQKKHTKITPFWPFKMAVIKKPLVPLGSKFFWDSRKNSSSTCCSKND